MPIHCRGNARSALLGGAEGQQHGPVAEGAPEAFGPAGSIEVVIPSQIA